MAQPSPAPFKFGSGNGDAGEKGGFNFDFIASRPISTKGTTKKAVKRAEEKQDSDRTQTQTKKPKKKAAAAQPTAGVADEDLQAWVYQQFLDHGFGKGGFKGFATLTAICQRMKPNLRGEIPQVVNKLRRPAPGARYSFGNLDQITRDKKRERLEKESNTRAQQAAAQAQARLTSQRDKRPSESALYLEGYALPDAPSRYQNTLDESPAHDRGIWSSQHNTPRTGLLATKLNQLHLASTNHHNEDNDSGVDVPSPTSNNVSDDDKSDDEEDEYSEISSDSGTDGSSDVVHDEYKHERMRCDPNQVEDNSKALSGDKSVHVSVDHDGMNDLLSDDSDNEDEEEEPTDKFDAEILHAPLLDGEMISTDGRLLPQYGLMGSHKERSAKSRMFLNTNTPFSAFICGVQGSGKSHTTACILENSLIPSKNLGHLERPLSALVFSYGHFSGDGSGYSISEAAFLASPSPQFPRGAHIKRINVLVSPSNFVRISKLYLRLPNVTVTKFMLDPRKLDIDIMLTLMNVSESDEQPLYMAQVTQILREMATTGTDFNYGTFKQRLREQQFNPAQTNMLQIRLNLLESFLDLKNTCPKPQFRPGEITIMDMSCPFVDANTACILFRIGLTRYLQSDTAGKMIVLDEAHKYMIDVPGAKALNEELLQTIRLQRHYGARVVISTQEPTLLTDIIALCSITVIHRFSSPEWFSAIKRHIPVDVKDREDIMRTIESLKTGTALVYAPNAVLGWKEKAGKDGEGSGKRGGGLVKGTGRMMKLSMRKRITSDGGQSVLAV